MARFALTSFLLFSFFWSYARQNKLSVGDIEYDAKTDDPKFKFCNNKFVLQGYELKTRSDETRHWISQQLKQRFLSRQEWNTQTGFITIRFAVNCFGLTDRFRAMGVTSELQFTHFEESLNQYLISLTKEIKWPAEKYKSYDVDYFQDVTFKIVKGELKEVVL